MILFVGLSDCLGDDRVHESRDPTFTAPQWTCLHLNLPNAYLCPDPGCFPQDKGPDGHRLGIRDPHTVFLIVSFRPVPSSLFLFPFCFSLSSSSFPFIFKNLIGGWFFLECFSIGGEENDLSDCTEVSDLQAGHVAPML